MLGTLEKAQRVLDLYSPARPEWGVGEVARECGWPPSSTHLLLSSLAQMGLLHRTLTGRYRLGFKLHRLSQILLHNTPWREVVAGELRALGAQTGETTYAAALDGDQLVTVAAFPGAHRHALAPAQLSEEPPLHASATGKVLLAFRLLQGGQVLPRRLPRLTPQTITTRAALSAELEAVRARGAAFNLEETGEGLCSVAAPVHNHNGEVIAAVCLLAPAERFRSMARRLRGCGARKCCAHRRAARLPPGAPARQRLRLDFERRRGRPARPASAQRAQGQANLRPGRRVTVRHERPRP